MFVTHGHNDHLGDTVEIAKQSNAIIYSNSEIGWYLSSLNQGLKCNPFYFGNYLDCRWGKVKMITAVHGSAIKVDDMPVYAGLACGFLFNINGLKIYHAGDTALFSDMKLLSNESVDVAILPIGGRYTMGIDEAVQAVDYIRPKTIIPMHFNTFDTIKTDPNEFTRKIVGCNAKILNIGESIEI